MCKRKTKMAWKFFFLPTKQTPERHVGMYANPFAEKFAIRKEIINKKCKSLDIGMNAIIPGGHISRVRNVVRKFVSQSILNNTNLHDLNGMIDCRTIEKTLISCTALAFAESRRSC